MSRIRRHTHSDSAGGMVPRQHARANEEAPEGVVGGVKHGVRGVVGGELLALLRESLQASHELAVHRCHLVSLLGILRGARMPGST